MEQRVFAIGDVHGCFDSLKELMEEKIGLTLSDKVILLGDYIDRGSKSKQVIDYLMNLKEKGYELVTLRGNHEQMLLDAYEDEQLVRLWVMNGGAATLKSFGISKIRQLDPAYLDFFNSLPLFYSYNNYLFVHAGFNDRIDNPFEGTYHMVWESRDRYSHPLLKDKIIVHGHSVITPALCEERILGNEKVIDLDTGCVFTNYNEYGRLTGWEITTGKIFSAEGKP
jgi:serine/threonine protein phosphatase 1